MEHVSWLTQFVNRIFGGFALSMFSALHMKPTDPENPIPEHVVMALAVLVIGTLLALWVRSRLSVERPGASQQIAELLLNNPMGFGLRDVLSQNAGHHWERYIPMVGSIALFVLLGNLFGAFPFLTAPTGAYTVPLACALITFSVFQLAGHSPSWPDRLHETFHRPGRLACSADVPGGNPQHHRPAFIFVRPPVGQYFRQRHYLRSVPRLFRGRIYIRLDQVSDSRRSGRRSARAVSHPIYCFCTFSFPSCKPTCSPFCRPCTSAWPPRTSTNQDLYRRSSVSPAARCPGTTSWRQFMRRK